MGSGDVVTNRSAGFSADLSTDLWVERLKPAASAPALQDQTPAAEVRRKARRRPRPNQEADAGSSSDPDFPGDEPKHKVDSLA
ncbi:MAG: hypothetical protein WAN60_01530 [Candidatus Sulfotelmatobacter sp.]